MISLDYSWFLAKKYSNFVTLPWKLHNRYCRRLKLKLNDPPKNACALQLQPLIFLWDTAYFFWPLHFLDWYPLKLEMDHLKECDICLHCIAFYDLGLHDYTIAYCWCCINKPLRFTMGSTSSFDALNDTLEMPEEGAGGQFPAQFFGRSVNPFPTRAGGRLCPPHYYQPPRFLDGATSLRQYHKSPCRYPNQDRRKVQKFGRGGNVMFVLFLSCSTKVGKAAPPYPGFHRLW